MTETTQLPLNIETGETVYQDRNQKIQRVVARFEGFSKEYFISDHGQRAAVVVVKNAEVLLVRQYRVLINNLSYEIPGGKIEEKETPEAAASRECLEETGIKCVNLKPLIDYLPSLDIWKNHTYVCYSEEYRDMDRKMADRRVWVPLARCIDMIFDRQITDSLSIIGIMAYNTMLGRR
jgi:ADP-ribose pyrophosphatase YjhB (NUDIX family)